MCTFAGGFWFAAGRAAFYVAAVTVCAAGVLLIALLTARTDRRSKRKDEQER